MKTVEAKLVALGSQGVGKTSMINRYINKDLWEFVRPTISADFFTCVINTENTRVVLKVWDTAGQEKFRSMAPMYYRNTNAALLMFDITRYDTFIGMKDWVTELHKNVQESIVLVVIGNKSDLKMERQVDAEESRAYAAQIGANYHETSVVTNDRIEDVFLDVARGLIRLSSTARDFTSLQVYEATTSVDPDFTEVGGMMIESNFEGNLERTPQTISINNERNRTRVNTKKGNKCC